MSPTAREVSKDAHHIYFYFTGFACNRLQKTNTFNKDTKKKGKGRNLMSKSCAPNSIFFLQYGNVVKNTYYYVLVGNSVHRSSKLSEYVFS